MIFFVTFFLLLLSMLFALMYIIKENNKAYDGLVDRTASEIYIDIYDDV